MTEARVLVFTGKGGVGKSTLAAATAVACQRYGHRVRIVSSDPAHSLGDVFGVDLEGTDTAEADGVVISQPDARNRLGESWESIRQWFVEVLAWTGASSLEAEELAVLPGMEELFALTEVCGHARSGDYDVVVVDCGPTAETIRLLSLPAVLGWYVDRVLPPSRQINRLVGPLISRVSNAPVPDDGVFEAADKFTVALDDVRRLLTDADRTSIRLVAGADRVIAAEARRTHGYLSLFGYGIDAVFVNRLLPESAAGALPGWVDGQQERIDQMVADFDPVPVLPVELAPVEPVGTDALTTLAATVYGETDPARRFHRHDAIRLDLSGPDPVIEIDLPHIDSGRVEVHRRGEELSIAIGPHRSALVLPAGLRRRSVRSAALRHGVLRVQFDDRVSEPAKSEGGTIG